VNLRAINPTLWSFDFNRKAHYSYKTKQLAESGINMYTKS